MDEAQRMHVHHRMKHKVCLFQRVLKAFVDFTFLKNETIKKKGKIQGSACDFKHIPKMVVEDPGPLGPTQSHYCPSGKTCRSEVLSSVHFTLVQMRFPGEA